MRVLVDTNIILDVALQRENFFVDSDNILKLCRDKKISGVLAAHTITNLFYILRTHFTATERLEIITDLLVFMKVEPLNIEKISRALLNKNFKDFEDCLQVECAKAANVDYIITRDKTDFVESEISCVTPNEFCCMFSE